MGMVVRRFEVCLVNLDPARGSKIRKTRPCLVISPDEMNQYVDTIIVAPMTTKEREYPTRVSVRFQKRSGQIVLDQIRTIDKSRCIKRLGQIGNQAEDKVLTVLAEMFAR